MHVHEFLELAQQNGTMPDIGVGGDFGPHFHERDLFALLREMNGAFAAGKTAAEHHHAVCTFGASFVEIVDHDDVFAVHAEAARWVRSLWR